VQRRTRLYTIRVRCSVMIIFNPINDIIFFVCTRCIDTAHVATNCVLLFLTFCPHSRPFAYVCICPINRTRFNETIIIGTYDTSHQPLLYTSIDDYDDDNINISVRSFVYVVIVQVHPKPDTMRNINMARLSVGLCVVDWSAIPGRRDGTGPETLTSHTPTAQ
jgi:hypothetical protein